MRAHEFITEHDNDDPGIGLTYGGWFDDKNNIYTAFQQEEHMQIIKRELGPTMDFDDAMHEGWVRAVWEHGLLNLQAYENEMKRVIKFMFRRKLFHPIHSVTLEPYGRSNEYIIFNLPQDRIKMIEYANSK